MTTQTSPSAASRAQRESSARNSSSRHSRQVQWHRHSCLCAFAGPRIPTMARTTASLASKSPEPREVFLIANPRLEFRLSHRKHSPLKISNRKFIAIFHSRFSPRLAFPQVTNHESRTTDFLIDTPRLEINVTSTKQRPEPDSNRYKNRTLQKRPPGRTAPSLAPPISSRFTHRSAVVSKPISPPRRTS
jgi:hypothetical protein